MNRLVKALFLLLFLLSFSSAFALDSSKLLAQDPEPPIEEAITTAESGEHEDTSHGKEPALWSVIPFIALLTMIATGPLFYAHFWHKNYPLIAAVLAAIVVSYYIFLLHNTHQPIHAMAEYFSFIALIAALFIASGGILISIDKEGTPFANIALLVFGALIANIIGTTGASMLLIRPFIRLNQHRIKAYHIIFFIFIISNVGGCLTPIGDPPLFLGFLKGVPFFWTLEHIWPKWFFGIGLLSIIFYMYDKRNHAFYQDPDLPKNHTGKIKIVGLRNVLFLAITIGAVFLDPNILDWVPALVVQGIEISFVRELIMIGAATAAYYTADKVALKGNDFNFEPIKEVGFLFIGIFGTMMPALQLIGNFAHSPAGSEIVNVHSLYWFTGALSGVLDNAPTYLNFLAAGMGKEGLDIAVKDEVFRYSAEAIKELIAISVAAVFFGAFTYIGNAPNFMVKSIAEQVGVRMPSFVGYIIRFSIPVLLPVLFLVWLVFFLLF